MIDPQNPQGPTYGQNHKKLFDGLSEQGLYTNSYEEFTVKYSSPEQQKKLFEGLKDIGMYTKSSDDFYTQYFNVKKKRRPNSPPSHKNRLLRYPFWRRILRNLRRVQVRRHSNRVEIRILL